MHELRHTGGCHCGRVQFEVYLPTKPTVVECRCSICVKSGYLHLIVHQSRFRLLEGAEVLTTYTFNTGIAKHLFCRVCGIKSFYVPRSHPDSYSVNARCIDTLTIDDALVERFDGDYPDARQT